MVISAINRLSGQTVRYLQWRFTKIMAPQTYRGAGAAASSAFTFFSHVRDLPLSISLLLHLSLHLSNHLLHPSQLCNTEQETCQGNDRRHRQIAPQQI